MRRRVAVAEEDHAKREAMKIDGEELRFFLTGGISTGENAIANPAPEWLSDKAWGELLRSRDLPGMRAKARSIHWSPYDRVGVVNADP